MAGSTRPKKNKIPLDQASAELINKIDAHEDTAERGQKAKGMGYRLHQFDTTKIPTDTAELQKMEGCYIFDKKTGNLGVVKAGKQGPVMMLAAAQAAKLQNEPNARRFTETELIALCTGGHVPHYLSQPQNPPTAADIQLPAQPSRWTVANDFKDWGAEANNPLKQWPTELKKSLTETLENEIKPPPAAAAGAALSPAEKTAITQELTAAFDGKAGELEALLTRADTLQLEKKLDDKEQKDITQQITTIRDAIDGEVQKVIGTHTAGINAASIDENKLKKALTDKIIEELSDANIKIQIQKQAQWRLEALNKAQNKFYQEMQAAEAVRSGQPTFTSMAGSPVMKVPETEEEKKSFQQILRYEKPGTMYGQNTHEVYIKWDDQAKCLVTTCADESDQRQKLRIGIQALRQAGHSNIRMINDPDFLKALQTNGSSNANRNYKYYQEFLMTCVSEQFNIRVVTMKEMPENGAVLDKKYNVGDKYNGSFVLLHEKTRGGFAQYKLCHVKADGTIEDVITDSKFLEKHLGKRAYNFKSNSSSELLGEKEKAAGERRVELKSFEGFQAIKEEMIKEAKKADNKDAEWVKKYTGTKEGVDTIALPQSFTVTIDHGALIDQRAQGQLQSALIFQTNNTWKEKNQTRFQNIMGTLGILNNQKNQLTPLVQQDKQAGGPGTMHSTAAATPPPSPPGAGGGGATIHSSAVSRSTIIPATTVVPPLVVHAGVGGALLGPPPGAAAAAAVAGVGGVGAAAAAAGGGLGKVAEEDEDEEAHKQEGIIVAEDTALKFRS